MTSDETSFPSYTNQAHWISVTKPLMMSYVQMIFNVCDFDNMDLDKKYLRVLGSQLLESSSLDIESHSGDLWALIQPSPSPPSLPSSGLQPSGQARNPLSFKANKLDEDSLNGSCQRKAPQPGLLSPLPGQLVPVLEGPARQKTRCVTITGPLEKECQPWLQVSPRLPQLPPFARPQARPALGTRTHTRHGK